MIRFSTVPIVENVNLLVTYEYYVGDDGLWNYPNGDPGYPATPDEIEIISIELSGDFTEFVLNFKGYDWLEGKLFELND